MRVGDIIRIKSPNPKKSSNPKLSENMQKYAGKIAIIKSYEDGRIKLDIDNECYSWEETALEPAKNDMHAFLIGDKVTVWDRDTQIKGIEPYYTVGKLSFKGKPAIIISKNNGWYQLDICPKYNWASWMLVKTTKNETELQREKNPLNGGEKRTGSVVHGKRNKSSVAKPNLGNPTPIRGK